MSARAGVAALAAAHIADAVSTFVALRAGAVEMNPFAARLMARPGGWFVALAGKAVLFASGVLLVEFVRHRGHGALGMALYVVMAVGFVAVAANNLRVVS